MSRSYKKNLVLTYSSEKGSVKKNKRTANKKVRQYLKNLDNDLKGEDYKKIYPSWDIKDFIGDDFVTWEEYWLIVVRRWEKIDSQYNKPFPDKKREYRKWYQWYKAK